MYKYKQCKVQCEMLSQGGMDYVCLCVTINQSVYVDISLVILLSPNKTNKFVKYFQCTTKCMCVCTKIKSKF